MATTDHSKSDVGFLQRGAVVRPVASNGHNFAVTVQLAVDDPLHEGVLVRGGGPGQHPQPRPD